MNPDQLKCKMKVTLNGNPSNLKEFMILILTLISTLMLTQGMTLKILKSCIWIGVRFLGQRFLLVKQYPYSLLNNFNSQWVDNGNLTLAFDHGL